MPELPEVETLVRGLREPLMGQTIQAAVFSAGVGRMTNIPAGHFAERIAGQAIRGVGRRAKYIVLTLDQDTLLIHLKMTGRLYVLPPTVTSEADRYLRVRFPLANGTELRFSDARRFGRVYLAAKPEEVLPALGPEPLEPEFTVKAFSERLTGRKAILKSLLLDQSFVAGIGNIYADESLHIARLHPLRTADTLSKPEIKRLHGAIRQALEDGVRYQGASIQWYRKADGEKGQSQEHLRVYHDPRIEKDKRCPNCGTPIETIRVGQRGTHFCPVCQK
jgi:formamidopyrimidine-DNA glycosylase